MALFTLYYQHDGNDTCDTIAGKKEMTRQQFADIIKNEIRFEKIVAGDVKRYKSNVIVLHGRKTDEVLELLNRVQSSVDYPQKTMISKAISLMVGIPVDHLGMAEPVPGHSTDIMIAIPGHMPDVEITDELKYITLQKRSLEQLMEMLPDGIVYDGSQLEFMIRKSEGKFICLAVHRFGSGMEPFFAGNMKFEFESKDPAIAISMMLGHLKYNKII